MNALQTKGFDYSVLNSEDANYLMEAERKIKDIASNAIFQIGEILFRTQAKLSNHKNGTFEKWINGTLCIHAQTGYNYINYYKFYKQNPELPELPVSLIYEASKQSTSKELKQAVIEGDIQTRKEYMELKNKLEQSNRDLNFERQKAAEFEEANRSLQRQLDGVNQTKDILKNRAEELTMSIRGTSEQETSKLRHLLIDTASYINSVIPRIRKSASCLKEEELKKVMEAAIPDFKPFFELLYQLSGKDSL